MTHPIKLHRAHRALRPKGASTLLRDVVCCVYDYVLNEAIMTKVRFWQNLEHEGTSIQLFPDFCWITIQKCRHLKPLFNTLKEPQISYGWNFPFALTARRDGRFASLKIYADLHNFCKTLQIPLPQLPDWDLEPPLTLPSPVWQSTTSKNRSSPAPGPSGQTLRQSPHC